jgi:hypothetical protein
MADQWSLYRQRSIEEMSIELEKNVGNRAPYTLSHCFEQYPALFVSPIRAFQLHIAGFCAETTAPLPCERR